MKTNWSKQTAADKTLLILRMITSVGAVVFAFLQLLGIWDKAINLAELFLGLGLLLQSVQEWNKHRSVAIFGLCAAIFVFACAIVVWLVP